MVTVAGVGWPGVMSGGTAKQTPSIAVSPSGHGPTGARLGAAVVGVGAAVGVGVGAAVGVGVGATVVGAAVDGVGATVVGAAVVGVGATVVGAAVDGVGAAVDGVGATVVGAAVDGAGVEAGVVDAGTAGGGTLQPAAMTWAPVNPSLRIWPMFWPPKWWVCFPRSKVKAGMMSPE